MIFGSTGNKRMYNILMTTNKFDNPDLQPLISRLMSLVSRKTYLEEKQRNELREIDELIAEVHSQMSDIEPDCINLKIVRVKDVKNLCRRAD